TQHVGCLGELDVVVAHDLDAIAPGIAEVEEAAGQHLDASRLQGAPRRLLVVDHQAEMAAVVGRLLAALLERDELIAEVDEGHGLALAAQLEREKLAIERQRLLDVADLERDMVEAHNSRLPESATAPLLCWSGSQVGTARPACNPAQAGKQKGPA